MHWNQIILIVATICRLYHSTLSNFDDKLFKMTGKSKCNTGLFLFCILLIALLTFVSYCHSLMHLTQEGWYSMQQCHVNMLNNTSKICQKREYNRSQITPYGNKKHLSDTHMTPVRFTCILDITWHASSTSSATSVAHRQLVGIAKGCRFDSLSNDLQVMIFLNCFLLEFWHVYDSYSRLKHI